jgi:hypothetical protein
VDELEQLFGARFSQMDKVWPPTSWRYDGPVTFETGELTFSALPSSSLVLGNDEADGVLNVPERLSPEGSHVLMGRLMAECDGVPIVGENAYCYVREIRSSTTGLEVHLNGLTVGSINDAEAAFTREMILGQRLSDSKSFGFNTTVFGSDAVVSERASVFEGPIDSVAIAYEGEPISDEQRWALYDVLRFVCGTRGSSTIVEAFDSNGKRMAFRVKNSGSANLPTQFIQPLDLESLDQVDELASSFPTMLDRMLLLREGNAPGVAAMIHHYNDGSVRPYPTSRIRDLSVALDALVGAVNKKQGKRTPMPGITDFEARIAPVIEAFDRAFADLPTGCAVPTERDRIRTKIAGANMMSPRQEFFAFFDDLGIGFKPFEKKLVDGFRNGVLHAGRAGDESELTDLQRNERAANALANIYHRSLLKILGFAGHYRDAHDRKSFRLDEVPDYGISL